MKAVLILDEMPNNCSECPCCNDGECGNQYKGDISEYLEWGKGRPSWCPLKPMPSYKAVDLNDTRDVVMFCHGWNTCLNEITGETE